MEQFIESWDCNFSLVETKSKRPGVLATWAGEFCYANLPSRNRRVYPTEAWTNALGNSNVKRLLEDRLMFGTVGHHEADFDTLVRDKKVSHVTTKIDFNEKTGIGRGTIDILDTPVGQVLHTLLKSGSKVCVSSKAIGEYKGEDGEGNQLVDPKKFKVERWDAVIDPGYLQAQPKILEKLEEAYHENDINIEETIEDINNVEINNNKSKNTKEDKMSQELSEKLMKEKVSLESELAKVTKDLELSESKNKNYSNLEKENKKLQEDLDKLQDEVNTFQKFVEEVGSLEEIKESLLVSKTFIESVKELGSVEDITEQLKILDEFLELGDNPESMKEALTRAKQMCESLKKLVDCKEDEDAISKIKEALEKAKDFIVTRNDEILESEVAEVSAKFGITEDKIRNLVKTEGKEGAIKILEELGSSNSGNPDNSIEPKTDGNKSSCERLLEHYTNK